MFVKTAEIGSSWYRFIPADSGKFEFVIKSKSTDDLDWIIYDLSLDSSYKQQNPQASCEQIYNHNNQMMLACNSAPINSTYTTGAKDDSLTTGRPDTAAFSHSLSLKKGHYYVMCVNNFQGSDGFNIYFTGTHIGMKEQERINPSFKIYPEPSDGLFHLSYLGKEKEALNICISDMQGRYVHSFSAPFEDQETVDLRDLSAGIYLMTLRTSSGMSTQKISIIK